MAALAVKVTNKAGVQNRQTAIGKGIPKRNAPYRPVTFRPLIPNHGRRIFNQPGEENISTFIRISILHIYLTKPIRLR